jgi:DNA-binding response OmpR family regulator
MSKKILIIEDDPQLVELLEIRLKNKGHEILMAHDGVSGLELAKTTSPHLIILDIELPQLNGFTICSLLKGHEDFRQIPIIMLTARREDADRAFDESFKPDAFFHKPFDAKALMEKIESLLGASQP